MKVFHDSLLNWQRRNQKVSLVGEPMFSRPFVVAKKIKDKNTRVPFSLSFTSEMARVATEIMKLCALGILSLCAHYLCFEKDFCSNSLLIDCQ